MIYLGDFLLKPRSKLAAFQEQRKKLAKKENKSLIEKEVQSQLIKVKSLETLVAQHKKLKGQQGYRVQRHRQHSCTEAEWERQVELRKDS